MSAVCPKLDLNSFEWYEGKSQQKSFHMFSVIVVCTLDTFHISVIFLKANYGLVNGKMTKTAQQIHTDETKH